MLKHLGIIIKVRSKPRDHYHIALSGNSGQGSKTRYETAFLIHRLPLLLLVLTRFSL